MRMYADVTRHYYKKKEQTFRPSANIQTFEIPSWATTAKVECVASKGADCPDGAVGGKGSRTRCILQVSSYQNLYVVVGNIPSNSNVASYNASDIRTDDTGILDNTSLSSRLIVAGAGGSGGTNSSNNAGDGGGLTGGNGGSEYSGKGGTQSAGGASGSSGFGGSSGIFGLGGNPTSASIGAGGAGWYGGGSGSKMSGDRIGSGGGGSSYTDQTLCTDVIHEQGNNNGAGYVKITCIKETDSSDYDYYEDKYTYKTFNKAIGNTPVLYTPTSWKKGQDIDLIDLVGYTVVGSPTIIGNIVSGFSANDGLRISNFPALTSNWEIVIKATNGGVSGQHRVISLPGMYLRKIANTWNLYFSDDSSSWAGLVSDYPFIKIVKTNNTAALYQSSNGVNYDLVQDNMNVGTNLTDAATIDLGINSLPWDGSIDLNNTYIKVNGQYWFRGDMSNGTSSFNQENADYRIENGELVYANPNIYLTGPVNYTVVGSPTIVDNVASGFSQGNYTKTQSHPTEQITSFEENIRFSVPTETMTTSPYITTYNTNNYGGGSNLVGGFVLSSAGNQISVFLFRKSDNTYTAYRVNYDFLSHKGEFFTVNIVTDMNNVLVTLYDSEMNVVGTTSATEQNLSAVITSDIYFATMTTGAFSNFTGSIDLNNTYIKINGLLWFYGKNYATQNIAPVPQGFTYGNTTATANGFVDMRTQAFTPAPTGATIVKGE